ncbi:MAG TPA: hypothetical protein VF399_11950 [bacterium]
MLLLIIALLVSISCSSRVNLYVECDVERGQTWDDTFSGSRGGDIFSDPVLEEMTATINDDTMEVDLPDPGSYHHYAYFWDEDTIPPDAGSEHEFNIQTDVGNASATVTVPGEFDITAPLEDDSIPIDAALDITWEASDGADWYAVWLRYFWTGDSKDTTVYVDNTAWTAPADWIDVDGTIYVYVYAGDGPRFEAGEAGNIEGAKGFCVATNYRANRVIVGAGYLAPKQSKFETQRISSKDFYRAYIKEMSKYSSEAAEMLEYLEF